MTNNKRARGGARPGAGPPRRFVSLRLTVAEAALVAPWLEQARLYCWNEAAQPVLDRLIADIRPGSSIHALPLARVARRERGEGGGLKQTTDDLRNEED